MTENEKQEKKTIEISEELYDAVQNLKKVFSDMSGKKVTEDEAVIGILVSGFIDSLKSGQQGGKGGSEGQAPSSPTIETPNS